MLFVEPKVSVKERIGNPCHPPTAKAAIHQSCVRTVSNPVRATAFVAFFHEIFSSLTAALGAQRTAPIITKKIELPFIDPATVTSKAKTAGHRHPCFVTAAAIDKTNQGKIANGSKRADCPVICPSTNGLNM
ncbi:MAG: Uncharacterised protein [Acidimicrobiales bacterium AG-410-I20]|nr:MAG: Uncharacterised protein [Acidimicrobiales bacterium AG-410-I20]